MNNRDYWRKRSENREIVSSDHAKQAEQVLAYNYRKAAAQMRKEINDFYNRYAGENGLTYAESVREMNRAELREWRGSVEDYIRQIQNEPNPEVRERLMREYDARSYNSRISRLDGLCGNANMILGDLYRRNESEFRQLLGGEYVDGFYKALYDIQTRLGYNGNFSTIDAQMIQNALNYPWSGANFSDRLWKNKEALMSSMREVITQGLIRGDSMPEMTRALAERLDASLSNAGRLIRTETSHIHNTAEIAAYEAAGYEEYEFMASFGERTCEVCGGLDGQHFKLTDIQYGVNFPPVHPNCRCTTVGWDEADEEPLQLEGQQQLDYEEWKKLYVDDRVEVERPIQPEPPVPVVPAAQNADNQRLTTGENSGIIKSENDLSSYIGVPITQSDNKSVREWYYANVHDIPNQIDRTLPFIDQVHQAFDLRNRYKHEARVAMSDRDTADRLEKKRPPPTFEALLADKMQRKNMTEEQALNDILETASKTNPAVDEFFDLGGA